MKKFLAAMMAILLTIIVSACGDDSAKNKPMDDQDTAATEMNHEEDTADAHADGPHEPGTDDVCAFCNMKVYTEADPMGVFTAQAKTKDGDYVFFDDSGCLLNTPRRDEVEFEEKWVRDYLTSEWIDADAAIPVKADIKTPMKYGYAFFKDQESAEKFIAENSDKNAMMASWEQIDKIANERYMKKMKMNSDSMNKDSENHMEEMNKDSENHMEDMNKDSENNMMDSDKEESGH
ncbi:nitrous oxide reductase accessory protein NosL [Bacillus sp. ISL-35]|uniref:nitrous oxide reductase accessory protein NosL n=1 Tax=Bacillus sp. ISL-35 TaxID=2819122 RepID=UPI001BE9E614|nr:nitrous oxide reductase accessory protein NosL [Bacillus sp. ISL-35]MBT2679742.1 nitrous oxide reductase accessory protein NosL [Bacillus sp. ISL-35]MBT2704776.1 nitrous oxide reductase accessory protein NosL [Chryseobacterium sp. ISL-80]